MISGSQEHLDHATMPAVAIEDEIHAKLLAELRAIVDRSELSQVELSKRLGVSRAYISKVLNGRAPIGIVSLGKFAEALGYDVNLKLTRKSTLQ